MLGRKVIIGKNKATIPVGTDLLYICGHFTGANQNCFAVLDKSTKQLLPGYPGDQYRYGYVYRVAEDNDNLYLVGNFTGNLLVMNKSTKEIISGFPTDWNNAIWGVDVDNDNIYLGGYFYELDEYQFITAIDKNTKQRVAGYPLLNDMLYTIKVDGDLLYIGGNFELNPRIGSAVINKTTKEFSTLSLSGTNKWTGVIEYDTDNIYIGGTFTNKFKVYNRNTKELISGYPTFDNFVHSIKTDSNYIYLGGNFTGKFAVIDKATKQLVDGYPTDFSNYISGIQIDDDFIYVGGFFTDGFKVISKTTKEYIEGYPTFNDAVIKLL